jgi:mono/diheme cytochrome c family protein
MRTKVAAACLGALLMAHPASAQPARSEGAALYQTYCASCHGTTGLGNGPVAPALSRPPANLTLYTVSNGGVFPAERLRRIIDGRDITAHGTPDMPVWGAVFKAPGHGSSEADVRARIDAIVRYIESIQIHRSH